MLNKIHFSKAQSCGAQTQSHDAHKKLSQTPMHNASMKLWQLTKTTVLIHHGRDSHLKIKF